MLTTKLASTILLAAIAASLVAATPAVAKGGVVPHFHGGGFQNSPAFQNAPSFQNAPGSFTGGNPTGANLSNVNWNGGSSPTTGYSA
jgi:hypothetical protein